jgi:hypothetical protein
MVEPMIASDAPYLAVRTERDELLFQPGCVVLVARVGRDRHRERAELRNSAHRAGTTDQCEVAIDAQAWGVGAAAVDVGCTERYRRFELWTTHAAFDTAVRRIEELVQAVGEEGYPLHLRQEVREARRRDRLPLQLLQRIDGVAANLGYAGELRALVATDRARDLPNDEAVSDPEQCSQKRAPKHDQEQSLVWPAMKALTRTVICERLAIHDTRG